MYYPIQRYKFESNSQRTFFSSCIFLRCIIRYKDTNLKAIHNLEFDGMEMKLVVLSDTKIQIWKQFTTGWRVGHRQGQLYYPIQRYKFESNSQPLPAPMFSDAVVLSDTKIQIWKQFTTLPKCKRYGTSCIIRYKDTNLKAIHNLHLSHL